MSHRCRSCGDALTELVADLGTSPLSNAYIDPATSDRDEHCFPLAAYVCGRCLLVQVPAVESPERIFDDYAYFSSYSETWIAHTREYCRTARERLRLGKDSQVIEIGSNDGCLLQHFHAEAIPVLGVEPAANVAAFARERGIETVTRFFGADTAAALLQDTRRADLLVANNVMPHVPDLHDFVSGLRMALAAGGLLTIEFPHLLQLMRGGQFDTIYHEHFSYFSLATADRALAAHGLKVVDVEELPTHGGSLRIHVRHADENARVSEAVARVTREENEFGLERVETYRRFAEGVRETKRSLLRFLATARDEGKRVAGYGAPAKANTLLNYCGIGTDLIEYTVDRNPTKQGRLLPGSRIPIHAPEKLAETRPDYIVVLPWNLRDEITAGMAHVREWGARFVIPTPRVEVLD